MQCSVVQKSKKWINEEVMKKFTLVYFTLAVTLIVIVSRQKAQATPLFFDKLQRLFGGGSGGGGLLYVEKKFGWSVVDYTNYRR